MDFNQDIYNQFYPGWDYASAQADWNNVGRDKYGGQVTSGGGVDSILNNAISSILGMVKKPPKPYEEANPFFFDEQLARNASEAQYAPYYDETLSDYVQRVERTKSRSQEDLKKTLDYLSAGKEHFLGAERRALDKAERNTNEGYAGAGLFFSGVRGRDIRELKESSAARIGEYETGYQYGTEKAVTAGQRLGEDIETEKTQYQRDLDREKKFAIESGVVQRKGETRDEYEIGRKKYYDDYLTGYI